MVPSGGITPLETLRVQKLSGASAARRYIRRAARSATNVSSRCPKGRHPVLNFRNTSCSERVAFDFTFTMYIFITIFRNIRVPFVDIQFLLRSGLTLRLP